jgi:predicted TIM-barrel fold metal-dependent hydrolase
MADPHRIDVHHHFLPPRYIQEVGDHRIGPLIVSGKTPQWTPAQSVEVMDRHGIATALTSMSAPGLWFGDSQKTRDLTRHCNEYAAQMRVDHKGRYGMFAALPLPDVDASLKEIDFALGTLKAEGFGLVTNYGGIYPGDAKFKPVFDELNRRKAVVFFHPNDVPCSTCLGEIPAATLEFPFDTTRCVTSLLYSGTLARCPDIKFIFSHAGGTIPFLAERIARLAARPEFKEQVPNGVIPEFKKLYYDTALSANAQAFVSLMKLVTPANVLFGTDYPFAPEPTATATVKGLAELGFSADELRAIERDNALRLMPSLKG